jgi:hypothetical protein
MRLAFAFFALAGMVAPLQAQMRDNRDPQLTCNDFNRERAARTCNVHETTLGPSGSLDIEPSHNGGITIKGWAQNNVLVRARIDTWAPTDAEAQAISSQVRIDTAGGRIRVTGPDLNGLQRWDDGPRYMVSLEIFTPWNTDLRMGTHNGGVDISDIRGRINFRTHNGGVKLTRLAGDVTGETHNGGVQVELEGNTWEGRQLDVSTHNGGVSVSMPAAYSASFETRTNRGRLDSDFPVTVRGRLDERLLHFNIGSGGPLIKVSTHNGAIRLRKN